MAKKKRGIGPLGWFARAFAAGFGAVGGAILAAALGGSLLSGVITTEWQVPAVTFTQSMPNQVVPAPMLGPEFSSPAERTASTAPIGYPVPRFPAITPPTISGFSTGEDEFPPEPDMSPQLELR